MLGKSTPRTYDGKAPQHYVGGVGRGAIGFTTRSDVGPAQPGVGAETVAVQRGPPGSVGSRPALRCDLPRGACRCVACMCRLQCVAGRARMRTCDVVPSRVIEPWVAVACARPTLLWRLQRLCACCPPFRRCLMSVKRRVWRGIAWLRLLLGCMRDGVVRLLVLQAT
jgi:hypothetical protein